jgi:D-alanyl-D-alanine carboxypeptidase (penicillin-binding protein 5/6)
MGGSQIFLKENEKMTFEDLFTAIAVASANDAVVALAEHTYGSTDSFVNKMNEKAKEFKMYNTNFINTTGFHDENHYTTAQDMAILARRLIHDYNNTILKYTSIYETYLREDSENPFWLVNTNKLLNCYDGMDGLKTGYTSESGYNLTATASRNNLRFISVIMGGNTSKSRNNDITTLLDYGFNNYKLETLYTKGETIKELRFINAREETTPVIAKEDINVLLKKTEKIDGVVINIDIFDNSAPKSNDQIIGKITIRSKNGDLLSENNLYVKENVIKLTFIDIFINFLKIMY